AALPAGNRYWFQSEPSSCPTSGGSLQAMRQVMLMFPAMEECRAGSGDKNSRQIVIGQLLYIGEGVVLGDMLGGLASCQPFELGRFDEKIQGLAGFQQSRRTICYVTGNRIPVS